MPASVLVTGANRGLGLGFVRHLLRAEGPRRAERVYAACRKPAEAEELSALAASDSRLRVVELDVNSEPQVAALAARLGDELKEGGLNLLINNAGIIAREQTLGAVTREAMMNSFEVNCVGPLLLAQALLPLLRRAAAANADKPMGVDKAAVVHLSTGVASFGDNGSGGKMAGYAYRCSKAALNMAGQCMGIDMKAEGVMSVLMLPGYVKTDMTGGAGDLTVDESVASMLRTMFAFGPEHTAGYYNYKGDRFPW